MGPLIVTYISAGQVRPRLLPLDVNIYIMALARGGCKVKISPQGCIFETWEVSYLIFENGHCCIFAKCTNSSGHKYNYALDISTTIYTSFVKNVVYRSKSVFWRHQYQYRSV